MKLVSLLTQQRGVSESQAEGGAGLIFKLAKDQLGGGAMGAIGGEQLKALLEKAIK